MAEHTWLMYPAYPGSFDDQTDYIHRRGGVLIEQDF